MPATGVPSLLPLPTSCTSSPLLIDDKPHTSFQLWFPLCHRQVVATSVPLSISKAGSVASPGNDSWARGADGTGFQHELRTIVDTIVSHPIRNVVWLAADVHYMQANAYDTNQDGVMDFHEFIAGPLSGASKTPILPDSTFHPTVLFSESGSMNFGKISLQGTKLEVTMIDDSGKERFFYRLIAQ